MSLNFIFFYIGIYFGHENLGKKEFECVFFSYWMYFNYSVLNWERTTTTKNAYSQTLWLGGLCMLEYLSVWVWGKREQEVLKFKILLTSFGSGGWGCWWNWKWKPFSSNRSEWVPWTRFHSQNLELLNKKMLKWLEAAWAVASWSWLQDRALETFPLKNLHLRFVCFVFIFIWGPHGRGLLHSFLCEPHCVPVSSFSFSYVVSYIFIRPHHIFFTVKLLKGCFQVGQLMTF